MVSHSCEHGTKVVSFAKCTILDLLEDFLEIRVDCMGTVVVCVSQILHIFCEVAKEENVVLSNLSGDFDLFLMVSFGPDAFCKKLN